MQSYRLLAAVPLDANDQPLLEEMERTAFSPELTRAAKRDGQQAQLKALQDYWHTELARGYHMHKTRTPLPRTLRSLWQDWISW